ncbi:MAG: nodulation protein E [Candidatus Sedimenticola sp. (ex Thyasira tokunagai)]
MAGESVESPVETLETESPSEDFSAYCDAEFERRKNSGETFNEADYREAMEMVLVKLRAMEEEGYA